MTACYPPSPVRQRVLLDRPGVDRVLERLQLLGRDRVRVFLGRVEVVAYLRGGGGDGRSHKLADLGVPLDEARLAPVARDAEHVVEHQHLAVGTGAGTDADG